MSATVSPEFWIHILGFINKDDKKTLATCLRVNPTLFEAAGKMLYSQLVIDMGISVDKLFLGHDMPSDDLSPGKSNFKRQLLQMTKIVLVRNHGCQDVGMESHELTAAAQVASNIKRVIVAPERRGYQTFILCERYDGGRCPILQGFKCKLATIHKVQASDRYDGPLAIFPAMLGGLEQVTLTLWPVLFYEDDLDDFDDDSRISDTGDQLFEVNRLTIPSQHIPSIRLIFALFQPGWDALGGFHPPKNVDSTRLIRSLAETMLLHKAKFDIYLLSGPEKNPFDLENFKTDLLKKLASRKTDLLAIARSKGVPTDIIDIWQPKIGFVGNDRDYFIENPSFKDELDPEWSADFENWAHLRLQEEQKLTAQDDEAEDQVA